MSSSVQVHVDSSILDTISEEIETGSGAFQGSVVPGGGIPQKSPAQIYFNKHRIMDFIEEAVHDLASKLPSDPFAYLANLCKSRSSIASPALESRPGERRFQVASQIHVHIDPTAVVSPPALLKQKSVVEIKLPPDEVDDQFASYLTNLATSIRRTTT